MGADKDELPKVNLSRLKFANWQEPPEEKGSDDSTPDGGEKPSQLGATNMGRPTILPFDIRRPEAYERMAADKPGEEMAHDATIWKLYLEEAEEHDQELVKGRQASLDMLLLFAALFSAILTTFLIESKNLLEQDPVDTSNALLLFIAQSQNRMERGLPAPQLSSPVDVPLFAPTMSARVINGIWFTSLALALSAALIAMLSKEWLTAYLSSRPRHAYTHALLRHSRMEGLERWWALHIIALLPSLLHLSLLLFSIGLVIYLWGLDKVIASVIAGVMGITVTLYATTAILGAIYDHCPYVTQISAYIQSAYTFYWGDHSTAPEMRSTFTSELDLKALLWLTNHARDPAVVDCAYQALAGLRLPPGFAGSVPVNATNEAAVVLEDEQSPGAMIQLDKQTTLGSLFLTVSDRFERLMRVGGDRSTSTWENAARYARVLAELAGYIHEHDQSGRLIPDEDDEPAIGWIRGEKDAQPIEYHALLKQQGPSQFVYALLRALNSFSYLWRDEVPSLHSDVYAGFVATELFLLTYATVDKSDGNSSEHELTDHESDKLVDSHSINVTSILAHAHSNSDSDLFNLRAQYSRALTRASTLIWFHSQRKATINSAPLNRLLSALYTAASCKALNPTTSLSTHHPQSTVDNSNRFRFVMPYNSSSSYFYDGYDISNGLLGDISALLRMSPRGQEDTTLQTRILAVRAFSVLGPVLLQQTLGISREQLLARFDYMSWPDASKLDMDAVRYVATRQAYEVIRHMSPYLDQLDGHVTMCYNSLNLVGDYLTEHQEYGSSSLLAIAHTGDALAPLMEFAGRSDENYDIVAPKAVSLIIDQVRLPFEAGWAICNTFLPPNCLPPLIRMIKDANNGSQSIKEIFQFILQRMRATALAPLSIVEVVRLETPATEYIQAFTHTSNGFSAILLAASEETHTAEVVAGTCQIIRIVAGNDPTYKINAVEIHPDAISSLLDVISMTANFLSGKPDQEIILLEFSEDIIQLLVVVSSDPSFTPLVAPHAALHDLQAALELAGDSTRAQELSRQATEVCKVFGIQDKETESSQTIDVTTDSTNNIQKTTNPVGRGSNEALPSVSSMELPPGETLVFE